MPWGDFITEEPRARGSRVMDGDGEPWIKGIRWWHWQNRSIHTGPGKLLWKDLVERYGPVRIWEDSPW